MAGIHSFFQNKTPKKLQENILYLMLRLEKQYLNMAVAIKIFRSKNQIKFTLQVLQSKTPKLIYQLIKMEKKH